MSYPYFHNSRKKMEKLMLDKFADNCKLLCNREYGFRSDLPTALDAWDLPESLLTAMDAKTTLLVYLNI